MNVLVRGILAFFLSFGIANAALIDRGGGMIYDNVLNITWLQDANYAKTSGYDADGRMHWVEANAWAEQLVYGGYDDWRLPTVSPINGISFDYSTGSYVGANDSGVRITSPNAELSYMFYVNLGNDAPWIDSNNTPSACALSNTCIENSAPFVNLERAKYWYGTLYEPTGGYWDFNMWIGWQSWEYNSVYESYAWAVRNGDVQVASTVPEPPILLLMISAAGLLIAMRQRSKAC